VFTLAPRIGSVHVVRVRKTGYVDKQGHRRDYESAYLRRTFRAEGKVKNETVANLSALPRHVIDWIDAGLKGEQLVRAEAAVSIVRSLPHGDLAAVFAQAKALGLSGLLGPACRERDLALALIVSRVVRPSSKLSTLTWWADTTLGVDLGVAGAGTDEIYAAMDWLLAGQDRIEAALARRHLAPEANPSKMALFDLSSSWVEGSYCPLAARGYSRDGKKGKAQIEYGLLTDPVGRPVAVRVFPGNTADPAVFIEAVDTVRTKFGLRELVMVGDRGMITSARIEALKDLGGMGWLTALRAPAIAALAADDGPLQLSLFDQQVLAEISHPDYPGERLIACHNPVLAADRARTRTELLAATEAVLAPLIARVEAGRLSGAEKIGIAVGKLINKYRVGKHFPLTITDTTLTITRNQDKIDAEAALDGIYVLRTSVPAHTLEAPGMVSAYKDLAHLERDFRVIKADDLDLRPIYHRLEHRVRAHVLVCMLACYLVWHLRKAWAPLTFTDEHPPPPTNPVTPAERSEGAQAKASYQRDAFGHPYRSFRALLEHLATLTRNQLHYTGTDTTVAMLTEPTSDQREAFNLIGVPIPLTLQ
jgi:Transposase DDE domain